MYNKNTLFIIYIISFKGWNVDVISGYLSF